VSVIDTAAVLEGFVQVVPGLLLNGKIVRLGDFGSLLSSRRHNLRNNPG